MTCDEFYVASNPPLTPAGVNEVQEQLKLMALENRITIYEVIYDPEVPWFRFTAAEGARGDITNFMKTLLTSIGEKDAATAAKDDDSSHADVETREESRLTPWSPSNATNLDEYDPFRFPKFRGESESDQSHVQLIDLEISPESNSEPRFKSIWRGIEENWPKFTSAAQFIECLNLPPANQDLLCDDELTCADILVKNFGVEFTWNSRETIWYIASDKSMKEVEKTIKLLDQAIQDEPAPLPAPKKLQESQEEDVAEEVFW